MSTTALTLPRHRMGLLGIGAIVGVLVAAVAGPAMTTVGAEGDTAAKDHIISVNSTGTVKVKPDVADVTIGVSVQRDRAGDASVDAANEMAKVIAALQAAGVAAEDIQTTTLSLDPVYDYDRSPALIIGYQATNLVNVTIRDLANAGPTIDAAVDAGATSIGSISFRLEDPAVLESQAREQAMTSARAKADELAAAAGVTITGVISIIETSGPVPMPVYYAEAAGAARDAATPIMTGSVDIEVSVAVVYSID
jgi:uncharacterized protein